MFRRLTHLVVTGQTVEILFDLTRLVAQLDTAARAVEVIGVVRLVLVLERLRVVDGGLALEARVLAVRLRL